MSESYHLKRIERDMPDRADQLSVLRGQRYLSLAMAQGDQPYLVSLNYGYDERDHCFYVHSAPEGRKLEFMRANPRVWGQVIEDLGYVSGQCSHAYRSVMFEAHVDFIEDVTQKRRALAIMIDHADPDPEPLKQKLIETSDLEHVVVLRLSVRWMGGKQGQ